MKIDDCLEGALVKVDGDAETVGQIRKINRKKGTVALMVGGAIRWVKVERIEVLHG
jgi:hypothetical protein